jgi:phosphatidylglycerol:prolipoprotein diacylglycerol transferase
MHPVLFVVPFREASLPLGPLFVLLAVTGAVVAAVSLRRGNHLSAALAALLVPLALVVAFASPASRVVAGPFEVRAWGAALVASLVVGSAVAIRRSARYGLDGGVVRSACVAASIGGVVGARLAWVLLHPAATGSVEGAGAFYGGGLSLWGGVVGALIGLRVSSRSSGTPLASLLDLGAPSFAIGVALTRFGCFLEGCDFGVPLSREAPRLLAALGTFPKDSPAWVAHVLERGLPPSASASLPVHPVALYEAFAAGLLAAIAFLLERRNVRPGVSVATILGMYLALRVSLDWARDDRLEMWVSVTLLSCVTLIGVALFGIRTLRARTPAVTPFEK